MHAGCRILGVEITDNAAQIHEHPFTGPTAFMLGNEVSTASSRCWRPYWARLSFESPHT